MADNYTQFSVLFALPTKAERDWMRRETEKRSDTDDYDNMLDCGVVVSEQEKNVWFYSEEGASIEKVAELMQDFLKKFHPDKFFKMTWASFCSKLRPDEFDGGAVFVTSERIEWHSAWKFFTKMEKQFNAAQEKAKASRKRSRQR